LRELGITVLRFDDRLVFEQINWVMDEIDEITRNPPLSPLLGGEIASANLFGQLTYD
jgi:hypothetical protein